MLLCLLFVLAAMPFIRGLGVEVDEALIGNCFYDRGAPWYSWHFGDAEVPVMLITYLGALKCWLYTPIFAIWHPGPVALRLPMMLAAAAALWLLFRFLERAHSRRAAWMGTLFLATDPSFLLIESIDLGFTALAQVFKLGGLLLLLNYDSDKKPWRLALAFFLFGLALWDKAVFGWVLIGLGAATLVVFPRRLWSHVSLRNAGLAASACLLGALPFVIYNIEKPLEAFRTNVKAAGAADQRFIKEHLRRETMNGRVLFGFLTAGSPGPHRRASRPAWPN